MQIATTSNSHQHVYANQLLSTWIGSQFPAPCRSVVNSPSSNLTSPYNCASQQFSFSRYKNDTDCHVNGKRGGRGVNFLSLSGFCRLGQHLEVCPYQLLVLYVVNQQKQSAKWTHEGLPVWLIFCRRDLCKKFVGCNSLFEPTIAITRSKHFRVE